MLKIFCPSQHVEHIFKGENFLGKDTKERQVKKESDGVS